MIGRRLVAGPALLTAVGVVVRRGAGISRRFVVERRVVIGLRVVGALSVEVVMTIIVSADLPLINPVVWIRKIDPPGSREKSSLTA